MKFDLFVAWWFFRLTRGLFFLCSGGVEENFKDCAVGGEG